MKQPAQLELIGAQPDGKTIFWWQWHGRTLAHEAVGWPKARLRRIVHHLSDFLKATSERDALAAAEADHPGAQTISLFCVGPVN
jgi:hypothetical protein